MLSVDFCDASSEKTKIFGQHGGTLSPSLADKGSILPTTHNVTPVSSVAAAEAKSNNVGARQVESYPNRTMLSTDLVVHRISGHVSKLFKRWSIPDHKDSLHSISLRYLGSVHTRS